ETSIADALPIQPKFIDSECGHVSTCSDDGLLDGKFVAQEHSRQCRPRLKSLERHRHCSRPRDVVKLRHVPALRRLRRLTCLPCFAAGQSLYIPVNQTQTSEEREPLNHRLRQTF